MGDCGALVGGEGVGVRSVGTGGHRGGPLLRSGRALGEAGPWGWQQHEEFCSRTWVQGGCERPGLWGPSSRGPRP